MRSTRQSLSLASFLFVSAAITACSSTPQQPTPEPEVLVERSEASSDPAEVQAGEEVAEEQLATPHRSLTEIELTEYVDSEERLNRLRADKPILVWNLNQLYSTSPSARKLVTQPLISKVYAVDADGEQRRLYKAQSDYEKSETLRVTIERMAALSGLEMDVQRDRINDPNARPLTPEREDRLYRMITELLVGHPISYFDLGKASEELLAAVTLMTDLETLVFDEPTSSSKGHALTLDLLPYFKRLVKLKHIIVRVAANNELDAELLTAYREALPSVEIDVESK